MKIDTAGLTASWVLTAVQTQEVFQIINLVLTCLSTLIVIFFTIWKWWKNAKADGTITSEEIQEGIDIVKDSTEKIQDQIEKGEK